MSEPIDAGVGPHQAYSSAIYKFTVRGKEWWRECKFCFAEGWAWDTTKHSPNCPRPSFNDWLREDTEAEPFREQSLRSRVHLTENPYADGHDDADPMDEVEAKAEMWRERQRG